tara:strand:- start:38342 stop:38665 length:324 start_codon:yes stop_codon:yes gene_type:complete
MKFNEQLQAFVETYDFDKGVAELVLDAHSCADMDGCIKFFSEHDLEVHTIRVSNLIDGVRMLDTLFQFEDGVWREYVTSPCIETRRQRRLDRRWGPFRANRVMIPRA